MRQYMLDFLLIVLACIPTNYFSFTFPAVQVSMRPEYILTLSCPDQRGIVHSVSGFLANHGCNIIDSAQFGDAHSKLFFMRVHFSVEDFAISDQVLRQKFTDVAQSWQMDCTDIEDKISENTKAIMAVHIYGHPCDMYSAKRI